MLLRALDILFLVGHCTFIVFILIGGFFPRLRRVHRWALLLVGASWCLLGLRYGFGYCPLTDWHWQVRNALGDENLPYSFITYLLQRFVGVDPYPFWVDGATVAGALIGASSALFFWLRDRSATHRGTN